ncbi:GntR family transcriptional regulator [Limimaricola pyoseonensis]|uniref:DNA-binding transcriptional regulator, GntR family n=1 Tax=Limimaricola pyoseonensis TaxID=521013 RepID=A0A1G7KR25_9RHOB|nr:GntR family transcriptional regulator [Limimaricola pyoseonensis]SDF39546.1 DNA-binding transcriptional regulator, GntR family [Limimaricola pyoseonensis]
MSGSRSDLIAETLEQDILRGRFAPGTRLDETRLAKEHGVSRTPIREAFQRLSAAGLVEQVPRRGVFVREIGTVELLEMFEVMAELEAACGRLAARRIADAALDELEAANAGCRAAMEAGDIDGYYLENERFHHRLYAESGNAFLCGEARRLHRRLRPFRRMQLQLRGRIPQSMNEHEAIMAALREGDAERAASLLRDHVAIQGEKFRLLVAGLRTAG